MLPTSGLKISTFLIRIPNFHFSFGKSSFILILCHFLDNGDSDYFQILVFPSTSPKQMRQNNIFDTLILRFNVSCCVFVLLVQPYVIYIISVLSQISKNYVYPDQKQDLTVTKSASKSSIILNRLTKITTLIKSVKT